MTHYIDTLTKKTGYLSAILALTLALLIGYDAMMRYLFSAGSIALQEVEWHLFDIVFLFGLSYALKYDKHVRVDIFFASYSQDTKALVQIFSMLFLLIPFSLYFLHGAYEMTLQSYVQNEVSSNPGALENSPLRNFFKILKHYNLTYLSHKLFFNVKIILNLKKVTLL